MAVTLSSHLSLSIQYGIFLSYFQAIFFNSIVTDSIKPDVSITYDVPQNLPSSRSCVTFPNKDTVRVEMIQLCPSASDSRYPPDCQSAAMNFPSSYHFDQPRGLVVGASDY